MNNLMLEVSPNFSVYSLAENRVHALKSLVELVLHELDSLQQMTTTKTEINNESLSLPEEVEGFEIGLIRQALIQAKGHQRNAARLLGIKTTTLHAKMRRHGIDSRAFTLFPLQDAEIKSE